jgi:hypothetical protein
MMTEKKAIEMLVHLISGALGGAVSTGCAYPFANLRLRRVSAYY